MKIENFISKQIIDIKTYGLRELFRKFNLLIKIFAIISVNLIAIFPCMVIRLISPWILIRIMKVPGTNFGNFVSDVALYSCKKKLKIEQPTKRYLDLLYIKPNVKILNKQLATMWKRKLNFFSGYLLDPIWRIGKFFPGWKIHTIEQSAFDVDNLIEKYQPLNFNNEEEIYGKEMLKKFGLKDGDKFVCLAVRDSAYQLRKIPARFKDWSYHDFRCYDVDDFVLAAEELAKRGYYIFRMGVVVNKPFKTNNLKIIDYANSNLRSDFMDIYLGARCSFCISTGYGFDEIPYFFGRPVAMLSVPFGFIRTFSRKTLILTKQHILKKEKRRLNLSEIFSHGVAYALKTKIFEEKGIELVDFTPDEIRDFVIEMAENLEFNKDLNSEDQELQKIFKGLYASNIKRHHEETKKPRKMHGQIRCCYSTKFLRENRNWLK